TSTEPPAQAPSAATTPSEQPAATPAPAPVKHPTPAPSPAESGSWVDWVSANWWVPAGVLGVALLALAFFAWRRRQASTDSVPGPGGDFTNYREPSPAGGRGRDESFVVEESGEHPTLPPELAGTEPFGETTSDLKATKASDDTMSSESAVNLDQGDPLAEAD